MSANNYIFIEKTEKDKYLVTHRDADTDVSLGEIAEVDNLESAVNKANDWQIDNGPVEYGLQIVL